MSITVGTGGVPDGKSAINRETGPFNAFNARGTCETVDIAANKL